MFTLDQAPPVTSITAATIPFQDSKRAAQFSFGATDMLQVGAHAGKAFPYSGFRVQGLGFRIYSLGYRVTMQMVTLQCKLAGMGYLCSFEGCWPLSSSVLGACCKVHGGHPAACPTGVGRGSRAGNCL